MEPSNIYHALDLFSSFLEFWWVFLLQDRLMIYQDIAWYENWWNVYALYKIVFLLQDRLMTYQDSGFSEEDQDHQVTTCLMKTPSGSIYIQPTSKTANLSNLLMFE